MRQNCLSKDLIHRNCITAMQVCRNEFREHCKAGLAEPKLEAHGNKRVASEEASVVKLGSFGGFGGAERSKASETCSAITASSESGLVSVSSSKN
eukprot:1030130-Amphidinium_carterae.1